MRPTMEVKVWARFHNPSPHQSMCPKFPLPIILAQIPSSHHSNMVISQIFIKSNLELGSYHHMDMISSF